MRRTLAFYAKITDGPGMDLLLHLSTFIRIAEAGSISQAARSLRISVAMASRQLSGLEAHLGVELVRRTTRRTTLTLAGEELLVRARKLLTDVEDTREAIQPGSGAAGLVVMSLPISFGLTLATPLFAELLELHPRLQFDLRFEDRVVDLLSDGVDIAIRAGVAPPDSPFVMARKLVTFERILCASPTFLERHPRIRTLFDLTNVPCIPSNVGARWKFITADGPQSVEIRGRVQTNTIFAVREAALAGLGVAMLPAWMVTNELRQQQLVQVLPELKMPTVEVHGLYHQGARGSQTIRTVLDYLAQGLSRRIGELGNPSTPFSIPEPRALFNHDQPKSERGRDGRQIKDDRHADRFAPQ